MAPKNTSYDEAPVDVQASAIDGVEMLVAPDTGAGDAGAVGGGGGGGASVVNDHTEPVVAPVTFFATTCQ